MPLGTCATASILVLACLGLLQAGAEGLEPQTSSWIKQESGSANGYLTRRLLLEEQRCIDLISPIQRKVLLHTAEFGYARLSRDLTCGVNFKLVIFSQEMHRNGGLCAGCSALCSVGWRAT